MRGAPRPNPNQGTIMLEHIRKQPKTRKTTLLGVVRTAHAEIAAKRAEGYTWREIAAAIKAAHRFSAKVTDRTVNTAFRIVSEEIADALNLGNPVFQKPEIIAPPSFPAAHNTELNTERTTELTNELTIEQPAAEPPAPSIAAQEPPRIDAQRQDPKTETVKLQEARARLAAQANASKFKNMLID